MEIKKENNILAETMGDMEAKINEGIEKFKQQIIEIHDLKVYSETAFSIYLQKELDEIEEYGLFIHTSSSDKTYSKKPHIPPASSVAITLYENHYKRQNVINLILDRNFIRNEMLGVELGVDGFRVLKGNDEWDEANLINLQDAIYQSFINYVIALSKRDYLTPFKYPVKLPKKVKEHIELEPKAPEFIGIDINKLINHLISNNLRYKDKYPFFKKEDFQNILSAFENKSINQLININGQQNYLGTLLYTLIKKSYIKIKKGTKTEIAKWGSKYFTWGENNNKINETFLYKNLTRNSYKDGKRLLKIENPLTLN